MLGLCVFSSLLQGRSATPVFHDADSFEGGREVGVGSKGEGLGAGEGERRRELCNYGLTD